LYRRHIALRSFPVLYAKDVEAVAAFYAGLGFEVHFRMPSPDGSTGYIGLRRDGAELAVTTEDSPRTLAGVERSPSSVRPVPSSCASRPTCRGASGSRGFATPRATSSRSLGPGERRRSACEHAFA
jgi:hypothetical protein